MSGLPNPRSTTSSPARRAAILSASMMPKTYGGSALMRRNSIRAPYQSPSGDQWPQSLAQQRRVLGIGGVDRTEDQPLGARLDVRRERLRHPLDAPHERPRARPE